jgi:hypothetical protein
MGIKKRSVPAVPNSACHRHHCGKSLITAAYDIVKALPDVPLSAYMPLLSSMTVHLIKQNESLTPSTSPNSESFYFVNGLFGGSNFIP